MILSNIEIHKALDNGWLTIEPEPTPRELRAGQDCPYQTSAVDLTLGNEISFLDPAHKPPVTVDLRKGKFADLFVPHSRSVTITEEQPYVLKTNQLVLAKTREKVSFHLLDASPCLAARVEGKSSFARCGLLVHFTAPTIHAGFSGTITLELINFGPLDIGLFPGMPICQLIIEQVHGIPFRNDSQFQNQNRAGGNCR
jgi:dCTP deaminase